MWWLDPPHDVHRQEGLGQGALELVVVASSPSDDGRIFAETDGLTTAGPVADAMLRAYHEGCVAPLRDLYQDDVIADGETRMWRDVHILRTRDGKVSEHLAYCTGHWDAVTIARQQTQAPMIRP